MIVILAIVSHFLYSFYIKLFDNGVITDMQTILLGSATLATVIGITVFVGVRYVLHLKKIKPIGIFR